MGFWSWKKKHELPAETPVESPEPEPPKKSSKRGRGPIPMEIRLLSVQAVEAGLTTKEVADLAGVHPSTIDGWRKAYRESGVAGLARRTSSKTTRRICKELEERIVERRKQHPERGVRRIRDDLRLEDGLQVSAETVRRVLHDADLAQPPPKKKRKPPQVRRFERSLPNAMWQTDIFTFKLKRHYPVYLVGVIDDHSRYIVGHGLFRRQTKDAVLEVVRGAIGQWGAPREMLSDNGRQFVAWRGKTDFQKLMTRQGIQHVRSAPQHPMTLGKIERFWKTIWTEYLEEAVFASYADAAQRIGHWVAYYNHRRPHQGIGGMRPADRFYGLADDVEEAVRQGCADNALRLALGQEPQPPLYLLGRLGGTDVRVTRKGEDIEVSLGDEVREVIKVGAPFRLDEKGRGSRGDGRDEPDEQREVGGPERGRAPEGGADGRGGAGADRPALRDLRDVPADAAPGASEGAGSRGGGTGPEAARPEAAAGARGAPVRAEARERAPAQGRGPVEDEVGGRAGLPGAGAGVRPRRARRRIVVVGEKNEAAQAAPPSAPTDEEDVAQPDPPWWSEVAGEPGAWD